MGNIRTSLLFALDELLRSISTNTHLRGMALLRACSGWILIYIYAINYAQRDMLFGPHRIVAEGAGLFEALPGELGFQVMYHLALLAALCLAFGWAPRLAAAACCAFFASYATVATMTSDGGDNLLRLLLFFMIFANTSGRPYVSPEGLRSRVLAIVHNGAWLAIVIQLCILYWDAGFQKAAGSMWRDGTALYYIMQLSEFHNPIVADHLLQHPTLLVFSNYATMAFQLAFPFLLLNRWSKYLAIAVSMSFHLGIMLAMCLISFSAVMMAAELTLLSDRDYERLAAVMSRVVGFVRKLRSSTASWGATVVEGHMRNRGLLTSCLESLMPRLGKEGPN